ncbi:MAG: hypothetical protein RR261_07060, partial [Oscillospiraceae bacterium]
MPAESAQIVAAQLTKHPEFKQIANDVYKYNDNLLQLKVDSGLVKFELAQEFRKMYPHYVPVHRKMDGDYFQLDSANEEMERISNGVKSRNGSDLQILPLYDQMSKMTMQTMSQAKKNLFAKRLGEHVWQNPELLKEFADMPLDVDGIYDLDDLKGENIKDNMIIYKNNGNTHAMPISKQLMEGVKELSNQGEETTMIESGLRKVNKVYKNLITEYNPVFLASNFVRDGFDAPINSKDTTAFFANAPAALEEIKSNGELWQRYNALGGTASSLFDYDYKNGTHKKSGVIKRNTLGRISEANRFVEQIPRFAEFYATVKKGDGSYDNLMQAMHNAADITVNFQRSGSWVKGANATVIPFLNASIQG